MSKIIIAAAGNPQSENVILSLLEDEKHEEIIGIGAKATDLMLSRASRKYLVPYAIDKGYKTRLTQILNIEKPDLIHFQNDKHCYINLQSKLLFTLIL